MADAFFVALKLPNLFRRLFGEGAFNAAFVPPFSGMLAAEGPQAARQFATEAFAVMTFWLGALTVAGEIFMPQMMAVLAPGFAAIPEKFALAVALSRITFPYLLLICLAALVSGVLNGMERFTAASASYVLFNVDLDRLHARADALRADGGPCAVLGRDRIGCRAARRCCCGQSRRAGMPLRAAAPAAHAAACGCCCGACCPACSAPA